MSTPDAWREYAARALEAERHRPSESPSHGTTLGAAHYWEDGGAVAEPPPGWIPTGPWPDDAVEPDDHPRAPAPEDVAPRR